MIKQIIGTVLGYIIAYKWRENREYDIHTRDYFFDKDDISHLPLKMQLKVIKDRRDASYR